MQRFAQLYEEIERTTRTNEKVAALKSYFLAAPPQDAAWVVFLLSGRKFMKALSSRRLRDWAAEASLLPPWLIEESYHSVGDLSETLALILPDPTAPSAIPLHTLIEQTLIPLAKLDEPQQKSIITSTWPTLTSLEKLLFHKLLSGTFRFGISRTLMIRALAEAAHIEPAIMAHRLSGPFSPTPTEFARLLSGQPSDSDLLRPFPFMLANPLLTTPQSPIPPELTDPPQSFLAEWKWDGIRAQLLRRKNQTLLWSRGEELISDSFPELTRSALDLPDGTVLDGEILAWENNRPLPFSSLQLRLNRKSVSLGFWPDMPVVFLAFDLLELAGTDLRPLPLAQRREELLSLNLPANPTPLHLIALSTPVEIPAWSTTQSLLDESRSRGVEGLMLKRLDSPYLPGRPRGSWWKWKVQPFTLDAVLTAAQPGHGRRAGLLTDYTFSVWHNSQLVPVAKAYSGLTDPEILEVDRFARENTTGKFGPVRSLKPLLVFEIAFEAIQPSTRHKAGLALRFPRILRQRPDKPPEQANTLDSLHQLLTQQKSLTHPNSPL